MRDIRILTGALLLAGLAAGPGWCAAADGRDSLGTEALRHKLEYRSWARVTGPWGAVRLSNPRIRATGLEFLAARPDAPGTDTTFLPNPIPLARVYAVEIQVNSSGKGTIFGGLVGVALGMIMAEAVSQMDFGFGGGHSANGGDLLTGAVLGAVPGVILGALLGAAFRHSEEIYPVDRLPDRRSR